MLKRIGASRLKYMYRSRTSCSTHTGRNEEAVESLRAHLSEQRHDIFNLLQLIYGFTQLKKPEKVLALIREYCSKMENIGRLYNARCIKLADLLYTKEKEAGIIDLNMEFLIDIDFEPDIRMLEQESCLMAINGIISQFFFRMHSLGVQNGVVSCHLKEEPDTYRLTVSAREKLEGPVCPEASWLKLTDETFYWRKISREVPAVRAIAAWCRNAALELLIDEQNASVSIAMRRNK